MIDQYILCTLVAWQAGSMIRTSGCELVKMPPCHLSTLSTCQASSIPWQLYRMPPCQTAILPGCHLSRQPSCLTARMPACQAGILPGCQLARLPAYRRHLFRIPAGQAASIYVILTNPQPDKLVYKLTGWDLDSWHHDSPARW